MKYHKLFSILIQLTRAERKDLEKFLANPLNNNRKLALKLYQFLQPQKEIPTKKEIFQYLFPNENYKDEKVRLCMSQLVKKVEAFLIANYQTQFDIRNSKYLAQIYQEKKLPKFAEQVLQQTLQEQQKRPIRNGQYFLERYDLTLKRFDYALSLIHISEPTRPY